MKKIFSVILLLVVCISLCACGKSEEVKAVEEMIASIGEVSVEKVDVIQKVSQAYDALQDEEKEKVDNVDILRQSMDALKDAMFASIALQCKEMNTGSDLVAESVIEVWETVGGENFWTWYGTILKFADESLAELDVSDDQLSLYYEMPAYALGRAKDSFCRDDLTMEERQEIVDTCVVLANTYYGIQEMSEQAGQDFAIFKELFQEEHADVCEFLREWYLASSVFVEFATNPSGNRSQYSADLGEHNTVVYKFQKEADLME